MVIRGEIVRNEISELMDGELDGTHAAKVINAIKNDDDLFSDWKIYHVVGDSLRQSAVNIDISEQVKKQLVDEPLLLAPYPHKTHQNLKQKLLNLSVAASIAALSVGWLISQSGEQPETGLKEVYMAEKTSGKTAPVGGHHSLMTFQPVSAYSSPSMPVVSTHYNNDPLIYRDLTYERSVRYPTTGMPSPAEVTGEQSAAAPVE